VIRKTSLANQVLNILRNLRRPSRRPRLFPRQERRNPVRCQRITVSGLKMARAERSPSHKPNRIVAEKRPSTPKTAAGLLGQASMHPAAEWPQ
jgi:hypothetical protein